MDANLQLRDWLDSALGYRFKDPDLIGVALSHRSVGSPNNERLEFLGDGVLNFVVGDLLYQHFAEAKEGELSRLRATLVKGDTLAAIAISMGVGERLRMAQGEVRSGGLRRGSILADAFEAIIGAVYVDGGFDAARTVIQSIMEPRLKQLPSAAELKDPKTRLQELLQSQGLSLPVYKMESAEGKSHAKTFVVRCEVRALGIVVRASGNTRRGAEQEGAAQALTEVLQRVKLDANA